MGPRHPTPWQYISGYSLAVMVYAVTVPVWCVQWLASGGHPAALARIVTCGGTWPRDEP